MPRPGEGKYPGHDAAAFELPFGQAKPNLPPGPGLWPLWQAARAPHASQRTRQELSRVLPADVAVTSTGCLSSSGENIRAGINRWLEQWTKVVDLKWWPLFHPYVAPRLVHEERVVVQEAAGARAYCLLLRNASGGWRPVEQATGRRPQRDDLHHSQALR